MVELKPWRQIEVPEPRADELYELSLFDRTYSFRGLKALLGAADLDKAGDRNCGLAAKDDVEREAARTILSGLTLQHLYDRPLTDDEGRVDSVMRINYDIDRDAFAEIAQKTLGELKNMLLRAKAAEAKRIGGALTGVMAAAIAKLCDVHELVFAAEETEALRQGAHAPRRSRHAVVAAAAQSSDRRSRGDDAADLLGPVDGLGRRAVRAQSGDRHGREHLDDAAASRQASPRDGRADADLRARRTSRRSSRASRAGRRSRSCSRASPGRTAR